MRSLHSELGASAMHRWANCAGSVNLLRSMPWQPAGPAAASGTVAHTLLERALAGDEIAPTLGTTIELAGHTVQVDQQMHDGIQVVLDYLAGIHPNYDVMACEQTVYLDSYFPADRPPPVKLFGRLDVMMLNTTTRVLEIVDYKSGQVLVSVQDNPQLLYYAAGAIAAAPVPVNRVRLTVIQPNAGGMPIRSFDLAAVDVLMWVDEILVPAVRAVEARNPDFTPGSWCRFCAAAHACPKLIEDAQAAAKLDFTNPPELPQMLDLAEQIERWITAVRAFAQHCIESGTPVPGWAVVPTRPSRVWTDESAANRHLMATASSPNAYLKTTLASPAQAEKISKSHHEPEVWAGLRRFIELKSSGTKLARETADTLQET